MWFGWSLGVVLTTASVAIHRQGVGGFEATMTPAQSLPNNLGPTLLIGLGFGLLPLLLGVPLVLFGLSRLRSLDGRRTFAHLLPF